MIQECERIRAEVSSWPKPMATHEVLNTWGVGEIHLCWKPSHGALISVAELKKAGFNRQYPEGTKQVVLGRTI